MGSVDTTLGHQGLWFPELQGLGGGGVQGPIGSISRKGLGFLKIIPQGSFT